MKPKNVRKILVVLAAGLIGLAAVAMFLNLAAQAGMCIGGLIGVGYKLIESDEVTNSHS